MENIKKQSIANNFAFQFAYQVWILIIPLIIAPYLTRVLGDTALGIFTYANSIAYYFILFANLGISRYGQRVIAKSNGLEHLRKIFWSLFVTHILFSLLSFGCYLIFIFSVVRENRLIYIIEAIYVLSALFDITWLFYGLENFKSVAIRNFLIKAIELVCVFIFVKSVDDLSIYTLITAGSWLIGQAIMIPQAISMVKPIKFKFADMQQHLKPLFVFFISTIAISAYTIFDKTLLGLMSTKENVAYYEYANKIVSIPRTFIAVIGTVLYPRACKLVATGDKDGQKRCLDLSLTLVCFIGAASGFGLLAISKLFSVIYYGNEFAECGYIMMGMAALPLICGLGEIVRAQYMIPNEMDKQYIVCIILNAIINLVLTCLFIPLFGVYGAVIGTCAAETFGFCFQVILCKRFINPLHILKETVPFLLIGLLMFFAIKTQSLFLKQDLISMGLEMITGAVVYIIFVLLYFYLFKKEYWFMLTGFIKKKLGRNDRENIC